MTWGLGHTGIDKFQKGRADVLIHTKKGSHRYNYASNTWLVKKIQRSRESGLRLYKIFDYVYGPLEIQMKAIPDADITFGQSTEYTDGGVLLTIYHGTWKEQAFRRY